MVTIQNILDSWMQERRIELIANYERRGQKASGKFGENITITTTDRSGSMSAPAHVWFMVNGRGPNADQSPEALRRFAGWAGSTFIAAWVKDKGISASPYAIAYSIARNGITVPNKNNDGKLLTETFTDANIQDLLARLTANYTATITSDIQKIWHQ